MARVKRGTIAHKRRKNVLKQTKGFKWGRKNKYKLAKDALRHAFESAYKNRKMKKREARALWNEKIGAAVKSNGLNYSTFINLLKKKNVGLDRKVLSQLAQESPKTFERIIETVK